MSTSHAKALSLEHTLRTIFNCERFGFGGYINSDMIEKNPVQSFALGLAVIYNTKSELQKEAIDRFLEDSLDYEDLSIREIEETEFNTLVERFNSLII